MVDVANSCVKSANAAKPRRQRNLRHGQARLINKFFSKMQTPRMCYRCGSCAEMF